MFEAAATAFGERDGAQDSDLLLLVKEAPEQSLERQVLVEQLVGLDGFGQDPDMFPFRMIEPGVKPLSPFFSFRQMLDQDAPGNVAGIIDRKPDEAWDLFRLCEKTLGGLGKTGALQRHDALVALSSQRLIECNG